MSKTEPSSQAGDGALNGLADAEARLGQVLALIHRVLPRLDEPSRNLEVQSALQRAASLLEAARQAHAREAQPARTAPASPQRVVTAVEPEIAAVIAAAVSVVLNQPYRLVSVQQVATPVPHLNVWALEGRTQIFQSHKIR
jgi:hypothetical protein